MYFQLYQIQILICVSNAALTRVQVAIDGSGSSRFPRGRLDATIIPLCLSKLTSSSSRPRSDSRRELAS